MELFAHDVQRKVIRHPAVYECPAPDLDGIEYTGDRQRSVDGAGQRPVPQRDGFAAGEIRRHGPERDRQRVEIGPVGDAPELRVQEAQHRLPLEKSGGQRHIAVTADADLEVPGEGALQRFAPERNLGPVVIESDVLRPVRIDEDVLDSVAAVAGRVQAADQSAHARADDGIHRDMVCFEDLQYAHVRPAPGPAAAEHQPDFRTCRVRVRHRHEYDRQ